MLQEKALPIMGPVPGENRVVPILIQNANSSLERAAEGLLAKSLKSEWTALEEERLLELVQQFPAQWATIGQILGRSALSCLEHYRILVQVAPANREINANPPNPNSSLAKSDPIDINERLSQARVRLADRKRRRAKGEAREKLIEESQPTEDMDFDGKRLRRCRNNYKNSQPALEEIEQPEEKIGEDMSEKISREKAEGEARRQALMRVDEDKSSFLPPTHNEQADQIIIKELLSMQEHDNARYPPEKKKGVKRKSAAEPFEDFAKDELKEADGLIKDEAQFLRVAMGHESESLDEFVEAHKTTLNDIMYFPTRNAYGLSSVAGNMEKLAALQNEFENVKKIMDDDTKKAKVVQVKPNSAAASQSAPVD